MSQKISETELLYDPMFAEKPVLDWTDSKKGGLLGKAAVKKALFIIILLISIAGSLFFSFSSLSKEKFEYDEVDSGYKLSAFHGQKYDTVLCVDYVRDASGNPDTSKAITEIRQFTSTGNDTLRFVFIGKDVKTIEKTAFFYCTGLNAVFVDDANENYMDIDGILYRKENGVPVEILLCPQQNTRYLYELSKGKTVPATPEDAEKFSEEYSDEKYTDALDKELEDEKIAVGKTVNIPETVTRIGQLCFAYCSKLTTVTIPAGVKEIETMAFFKCENLSGITLPDGLEVIGSDAFGKCGKIDYLFIPASVKEIDHHAFYECGGVEKVYMAAKSLDGIKTGSDWLPKYRKTFMKDKEIVFGAERGVK